MRRKGNFNEKSSIEVLGEWRNRLQWENIIKTPKD